jgi:hypothetical protein
MPIVEPHHDLGHPVEGDPAWSESYYFNGFDPLADAGLFTRIGVRPNEGTIDVGMSVWLPDGGLAEYRAHREQHEMADTVLEVGDVRYEMLEAMKSWRVTFDSVVSARPCRAGAPAERDVAVSVDLRFDAASPPIGTDGQGGAGPRSAEASAAAGTVGKGHFEQAGTWSGWIGVDGQRVELGDARGNRDRSWGPRRWGGPRMWRWFSINIADTLQLGGIRLGTDAGDLHRGWVLEDERATSIAEFRVRTELADDGLTQKVVHLTVLDKAGRIYDLRGDVLRVADIGRAGGTVVNEGLARWTWTDPLGVEHVGYGICEYLHQLDADATPLVAVE